MLRRPVCRPKWVARRREGNRPRLESRLHLLASAKQEGARRTTEAAGDRGKELKQPQRESEIVETEGPSSEMWGTRKKSELLGGRTA